MLLQAAFSDAGAQPWEMEERELDAFARALVDSPEATLKTMEDEIQQPRPSMATLLQLDR